MFFSPGPVWFAQHTCKQNALGEGLWPDEEWESDSPFIPLQITKGDFILHWPYLVLTYEWFQNQTQATNRAIKNSGKKFAADTLQHPAYKNNLFNTWSWGFAEPSIKASFPIPNLREKSYLVQGLCVVADLHPALRRQNGTCPWQDRGQDVSSGKGLQHSRNDRSWAGFLH